MLKCVFSKLNTGRGVVTLWWACIPFSEGLGLKNCLSLPALQTRNTLLRPSRVKQISLLTNLQPLVSSNILEWKHWFSIMVGIFRVTNILEGTTLQGSWSSVMLIVQLIVHYWLKLWRDLNHPAPVVRYDNYVIYGDIITCSTSQHSLWTVNRLYCQAQ